MNQRAVTAAIRRRARRSRRILVLLEALLTLAFVRAALLVLPLRVVCHDWEPQVPGPGNRGPRPGFPVPPLVMEVGCALRAVSRRVPPFRRCLPQSLAARWMLRRRRIAHTLCLGVRHQPDGRLLAHAWVRAAGCTVVGRRPADEFQMLAAYGACEEAG